MRSHLLPCDPFWLPEAVAKCPVEAADLGRLTAELQALPRDAPVGQFVDLYELMIDARDRLYEAWGEAMMDG